MAQSLLPDMLELAHCAQRYLEHANMPKDKEQIVVPLSKIGCQTHIFPVGGYHGVFSEDSRYKHFYIISPEALTEEQKKRLPIMQANRADLRLGYVDSLLIFHTQFSKAGVDKGVSKVLNLDKQTDLTILGHDISFGPDYFAMEILVQKTAF